MNKVLKWGLIGGGALLAGGALIGIASAAGGESGSGSGGSGDRCGELDGLQFVEVASDGGDLGRTLPLVVLLHGVNATSEKILGTATTGLLPAFKSSPPVRVVAPRGPIVGTDGTSWLSVLSTGDQATFRSELAALAPKLGSWIEALAVCRPTSLLEDGAKAITVMGFSQGAHVALAASTRLAGVAGRVVAVNGWAPADMFGDETAPITWISGEQDQTVPFKRSEGTAKELQARGLDLRWWPIKGVGHPFNGVLLDTVRAELGRLVASPMMGAAKSGGGTAGRSFVWNRTQAAGRR